MGDFKGFPSEFFDFFRELSENNDKSWFMENKARYEAEIVTPILAFIQEMGTRLRKISPHFVADPRKSGGSMFRIYRDVRFGKDKRPYKENAGCHFRHENGKDAHAPGFYVHLAPDEVFYGGGIWLPQGEALKKIRTAIAANANEWRRVIKNSRFAGHFDGIRGEQLTRPPRGFAEDLPHIDDIKRKSFFAIREGTVRRASTAAFADEVTDAFKASRPLMRFLCRALDQPF